MSNASETPNAAQEKEGGREARGKRKRGRGGSTQQRAAAHASKKAPSEARLRRRHLRSKNTEQLYTGGRQAAAALYRATVASGGGASASGSGSVRAPSSMRRQRVPPSRPSNLNGCRGRGGEKGIECASTQRLCDGGGPRGEPWASFTLQEARLAGGISAPAAQTEG